MGVKWSKPRGSGEDSVTPNVVDLAQYASACQADPRLTAFDTALRESTNRVINTLAVDVARQSLSFNSLHGLTSSQRELNHQVVQVILESQRDLWDDEDLFGLIEDYFKTSNETLKFCTELDNCLAQARDSQLILQIAVKNFEEEKLSDMKKEQENGVEGIKFANTLRELEKFKAAGNPFRDKFINLMQSVSEQQFRLLKRLRDRKRKVDQKLKSSKTWRRVSTVLFVAAFVSALTFSVVAAAVGAPAVVTALAGVLTVPIGSVGKWVNSLWKKYQNELKEKRKMLGVMVQATVVSVEDVQVIRVLVDRFEEKIESLMQTAELADGGDEAVKLVVGEMKGKIEDFMQSIDDLRQQGRNCSQQINMWRISPPRSRPETIEMPKKASSCGSSSRT